MKFITHSIEILNSNDFSILSEAKIQKKAKMHKSLFFREPTNDNNQFVKSKTWPSNSKVNKYLITFI